MVERFFRDITVYLREGSFSSVRELELDHHVLGTAKCAANSLCLECKGRRYFEQDTASP